MNKAEWLALRCPQSAPLGLDKLLAQTVALRDKTLADNPTSQRLPVLERDIQRLRNMGAKP